MWTHRVEPNPNVMLGKPVVRGRAIQDMQTHAEYDEGKWKR